MWVLDHLDDLDADFRAFYGVKDYMTELDGPRFFKLAVRVGAYQGVMNARVSIEREQNGTPPDEGGGVLSRNASRQGGGSSTSSAGQPAEKKTYVGSTQAELALAMPGIFEFSKAQV